MTLIKTRGGLYAVSPIRDIGVIMPAHGVTESLSEV